MQDKNRSGGSAKPGIRQLVERTGQKRQEPCIRAVEVGIREEGGLFEIFKQGLKW